MKEKEEIVSLESMRVKPGITVRLKDFDTGYTGGLTKERRIEPRFKKRERS